MLPQVFFTLGNPRRGQPGSIDTAEFLVGFTLGSGIVNINGGLANLNQFSMVSQADLTSTINLNVSEVRLNFFNTRANVALPDIVSANINFNGSLVQAKSNQPAFIEPNTTTLITANVQAGDAIFDTNSSALTIKQPLIHDAAPGCHAGLRPDQKWPRHPDTRTRRRT